MKLFNEMDLEIPSVVDELRRVQRELAQERAGAQQLRAALELSASYFHAPLGDASDGAAWEQIVAAIRSDAGRAWE
jgi:hypothetical protein